MRNVLSESTKNEKNLRGSVNGGLTRRAFLERVGTWSGSAFVLSFPVLSRAQASSLMPSGITTTTKSSPWQQKSVQPLGFRWDALDVEVLLDHPMQSIEGFGGCFNELGWTALQQVTKEDRASIFHELFSSGVGANFTLCRMPVGANDFSRDWYSYDETQEDFDLKRFSIGNDLETLVPFIHSAQEQNPGLKLWASPWSPPTWMKRNRHYADARPMPGFGT